MQIRNDDYISHCAKNDTFVIKQCIDAGIPMPRETTSGKETGFVIACRFGHLETVTLFLERMLYADSDDITYGLMLACMNQKEEVISYLLENYKEKFDLLKENSTLLSITFGREKSFYSLIDHDISFNTEDNQSIIIRDSFFHSENVFKIVLEKSTSEQVTNFISDLILRGDHQYPQSSDQSIYIDRNKNYSVLFSYLKNLEEDSLNSMKEICERYSSLERANEITIKSNALIFLEKINNYLLFYKLDKKIEHKEDKGKKAKL